MIYVDSAKKENPTSSFALCYNMNIPGKEGKKMIYVTSDLHGYPLEKFWKLLIKAGFSDNDYCYVIGDVIDRGDESIKTLKWLFDKDNIKVIMGNHEEMLLSCKFLFGDISCGKVEHMGIKEKECFDTWMANGARTTINELIKLNDNEKYNILNKLYELPMYKTLSVNGKKFLLTHGGLGGFSEDKPIEEYSPEELLWHRTGITEKYSENFITVFGHTPTHYYGMKYKGKAIFTDTWINIDTGAACGLAPMLLRLDDMKEFYINN